MRGSEELTREYAAFMITNNNFGGALYGSRANIYVSILSKLTHSVLITTPVRSTTEVLLVLTRSILGRHNEGVMHSVESKIFLHPLSMVEFAVYTSRSHK